MEEGWPSAQTARAAVGRGRENSDNSSPQTRVPRGQSRRALGRAGHERPRMDPQGLMDNN